jgi:CubicO group peptidase (beta-lactamase class C family)
MIARLLAASLLCLVLLRPARGAPPGFLDGFDAWMADTLATWKVPGTAVAVVQEGQVVLAKGYGLRDVERRLPVTTGTLFPIASITKSFTVLTLAALSAQGKLDWDRPVQGYLPGFRLWDEAATTQATPRDLLTHRTGLPRHDAIWVGHPGLLRRDLLGLLRHLEPHRPLRAAFEYNNLMFTVAGALAEAVAGRPWEDLVRDGILAPLGMRATRVLRGEMARSPDFALPYKQARGRLLRMPVRTDLGREGGPAGSITAPIEDMARYLLFQLGDGRPITTARDLQEMHRPQMVIRSAQAWPEIGPESYGMGWFVATYRGRPLVWHTGSIGGYTAILAMLPEQRAGVVAMANLDGARLPNVIAWTVFDRLLGAAPVPWAERLLSTPKDTEAGKDEASAQGLTLRRPNTRPSHDLADYAGEYAHPAYGTLRIAHKDGALRLTFGPHTAPLQHFHYDVFTVPEDPLGRLEHLELTFTTDPGGAVSAVAVPLEPAVRDIVFTRVVAPPAPAVLDGLCGGYRRGQRLFHVTRRGAALAIAEGAGEEHELVPRGGLSFQVRGRSWSIVEFTPGALVWHKADGSLRLKRVTP